MGRIPTVAEYMEQVQAVNAKSAEVYCYMNFDQIAEVKEVGARRRDGVARASRDFR